MPLSNYEIFPPVLREYDPEEKSNWSNYFHEQFLIGLIYGLSVKSEDIKKWVASAPDFWPAQATCKLLEAGVKISEGINQANIIYSDFFDILSGLQELRWVEDRDILAFQHAFNGAITQIVETLILLKRYLGNDLRIDSTEYPIIIAKPRYFSKDDLIDVILDNDLALLKQNEYESLMNENLHDLMTTINYFQERAKAYARYSKLARIYKDNALAKTLLKKAANNLLGYGYHKDVYLFDIIEAVEICSQTGISKEKINNWIARIVPLIENVGKYTDGDETNHFPYKLAGFLEKQNPDLLRKYYYYSAENEDLYHAERLFKYVVRSLSFTNEEEIALANTAIDEGSFSELKDIAETNPGAILALKNIQSYFGEINLPPNKDHINSSTEKPSEEYSKINPDHLLDHLNTKFENKWDWDNYLVGWLDYWLKNKDKETIYNTLKQMIDKFGIHSMFRKLLDALYPLAYEFDNKNAFDIICRTQAINYGWQTYWTPKKEAEKRWQFIKEKYPKRYLEFFQKSTGYHVPLVRGVEYMILFGNLERATVITEAGISFAESLMADITLSIPDWFKSQSEISTLDTLIQRLIWPSPLVRERAATALANLLNSSSKKEEVLKKLLSWINAQKLETTVAIGLLPIIKTFSITEDVEKLRYIDINTLARAIPINSEVIEKLFDELAFLMDVEKPNLPSQVNIEPVSLTYVPNSFFQKYVQTFLAPRYMDEALNVEQYSHKSFVNQWAFTADNILRDTGIQLDPEQYYYYTPSKYDKFLLGFSSKISEVYRSAFLRVLQNYNSSGDIPEDLYLEYAYRTLPIELSKWKILPNRSPEWWPKLAKINTENNKKDDPIPVITFEIDPASLVNDSNKEVLVAVEGTVQPSYGWAEDPMHNFMLIAFGYSIVGPKLPTPEEVVEKISIFPSLVTNPVETQRPFNFLEDKENYLPLHYAPFQIKDIIIYPIVARNREHCISLWQYFRIRIEAFNLNYPLLQELNIVLYKDKWQLEDRVGKVIATHADWLEGLKERNHKDMPIPHGQFLKLDQVFLNDWLSKNNLRLGYVLKNIYRTKQHSYSDIKQYEDNRLINVSSIIV